MTSLPITHIILSAQHVAPEVRNHHEKVIDGEQPVERATRQLIGDFETTPHRVLQRLLWVEHADIPRTNHSRHVEQAELDEGGNHVDDGRYLHAVHHESADILVLVDAAQTIKHPDHEKHGYAVYTSCIQHEHHQIC